MDSCVAEDLKAASVSIEYILLLKFRMELSHQRAARLERSVVGQPVHCLMLLLKGCSPFQANKINVNTDLDDELRSNAIQLEGFDFDDSYFSLLFALNLNPIHAIR